VKNFSLQCKAINSPPGKAGVGRCAGAFHPQLPDVSVISGIPTSSWPACKELCSWASPDHARNSCTAEVGSDTDHTRSPR